MELTLSLEKLVNEKLLNLHQVRPAYNSPNDHQNLCPRFLLYGFPVTPGIGQEQARRGEA